MRARLGRHCRHVWSATRLLLRILVLVGIPMTAFACPDRLISRAGERAVALGLALFVLDGLACLLDEATAASTRRRLPPALPR